MAVKVIVGVAGTGKANFCYDEIEEALANKDDFHNLIMLVPEQANLQVQLALAEKFGPGLLRVEVMSFNNLSTKLFKEIGGGKEPLIDDLERIMILKKVLEAHKKELAYFKNAANNEGSMDSMHRLMTIFEQIWIEDQALAGFMEEMQMGDDLKCQHQDMQQLQQWLMYSIHDQYLTL